MIRADSNHRGSHDSNHHHRTPGHWRDHVLAAASYDGTIVEYAKANNLKTKDIYQWKTALTKRGLLPMTKRENGPDFVAVNPVQQVDVAKSDVTSPVQCRLKLPCGSVLEYFTPVEPTYLSRLLSAVRSR